MQLIYYNWAAYRGPCLIKSGTGTVRTKATEEWKLLRKFDDEMHRIYNANRCAANRLHFTGAGACRLDETDVAHYNVECNSDTDYSGRYLAHWAAQEPEDQDI